MVGAAIVILLVAFGCEAPDSGRETTEPQRRFLSIGTAPPGGAFFVVGGAIAQVVDDRAGDLSWDVSAEATKGTQENIRRLVRGELDFALANAAISYFAVRGEGAWGEKQAINAVMTLAPNIALFVTPEGTGIRAIGDLRGKRVVVGPAGAGFEYFLAPILEAHGVTYEDFSPLHNTQAGAVDMLADGSAAAAFLGGAVPTASITQASASQDIRFIPFGVHRKGTSVPGLSVLQCGEYSRRYLSRPGRALRRHERGLDAPGDACRPGRGDGLPVYQDPLREPRGRGKEAPRGQSHPAKERDPGYRHTLPSRGDQVLQGNRNLAQLTCSSHCFFASWRSC